MADARGKWSPSEIRQMQWSYLGFLEEQGRYADKVEYFAPILAKNPEDERLYSQYLIALIYVGREAEAEKLIKEWLAGQLEGKDNEPARAKARAAVQLAMNESHPFGSRRYDDSWHKPLGEYVLRNAASANNNVASSVRSILQNSQFSNSDEMPLVSKALAARLLAEADKLTPRQLEKLVEHVRNSRKLITVRRVEKSRRHHSEPAGKKRSPAAVQRLTWTSCCGTSIRKPAPRPASPISACGSSGPTTRPAKISSGSSLTS